MSAQLFIAGVYGMKFDAMPDIGCALGLPCTWGVFHPAHWLMLAFICARDGVGRG